MEEWNQRRADDRPHLPHLAAVGPVIGADIETIIENSSRMLPIERPVVAVAKAVYIDLTPIDPVRRTPGLDAGQVIG